MYFHIVWTTRHRARLITKERADYLIPFIQRLVRHERAELLAIGLVSTHIHIVVRAHPMVGLPRLLQRVKGISAFESKAIRLGRPCPPLQWAKGYSVHTISERLLDRAVAYVNSQAVHHPDDAIPDWDQGPLCGPSREEA